MNIHRKNPNAGKIFIDELNHCLWWRWCCVFLCQRRLLREHVDLPDGSVLNPEKWRGGRDKGEDGESGEQALV